MAWDLDPRNVGTGLPLEGVRVLDLSRVLAGPLCAMVLGDLGADVIKVEGPHGDPVRSLAPPWYRETATYFLSVNRHRRMVSLDIRDSEDFDRLARLAEEADVVVENFLPHQVEELGVARIRERVPRAVWLTVTPSSPGTPESLQPTFDLLAQARSGVMSVTGYPDGPATKVGVPIADVVTGLYAAVSAVTGLLARSPERGATIQVPLLESMMSALVNQAQGYLLTGQEPARLGNDHPSIAPYGPVSVRDGAVMVAVGTDAQFVQLDRALDGALLRDEPAWADNGRRVIDRAELRQFLEAKFADMSMEESVRLLQNHGVPCAPILSVAEALQQSAVAGSDFIQTTDSSVGPIPMMASPLVWNGTRPGIRFGPGAQGADNNLFF